MSMLQVGDKVLWRGCFGADKARVAVVRSIDRVRPGDKYGDPVTEMDWSEVPTRAVVGLSTGNWAYGRQIKPLD